MDSNKETLWNTYNPIGYVRRKRQAAAAKKAADLQALPGQISQAEQNVSAAAQASADRYEAARKQKQNPVKLARQDTTDIQRRQKMNDNRQAFNEKQDIEAKEKEMITILGSASLGQVATQKRIKQIAQQDPVQYQKLLQLAEDIDSYHSKNDGFWKTWSGIGDFIGAAGDNASIARRILRSTDESPYTLIHNTPQYNSPVQQTARKSITQFNKNTFDNIDTQDPAQLLEVLRSIKQAYEYEVQNIIALPDGSHKLYGESSKRANDYLLSWKRATDNLMKMAADQRKYLDFLRLYKAKPLDPLTAEDTINIDSLIKQASVGAASQETESLRAAALGGK